MINDKFDSPNDVPPKASKHRIRAMHYSDAAIMQAYPRGLAQEFNRAYAKWEKNHPEAAMYSDTAANIHAEMERAKANRRRDV